MRKLGSVGVLEYNGVCCKTVSIFSIHNCHGQTNCDNDILQWYIQ